MKKINEVTYVVAIVGVAIMLILLGVTYAFFTASNNNLSASTVAVKSGAMKITYSDGTNDLGGKLTSTDFQPSNDILVDKIFTLTGKNTATADGGLEMEYYIGIEYSSTFTDGQLHWYFKRTDSNDNITSNIKGEVENIPGTEYTGYNHGTFSPTSKYVKLVNGVFKPNTEEQSVTFNLKMQFPDTGVEQDDNKGATFTGKILVNELPPLPAEDYFIDLASTDKGQTYLRYDETADNNLRYYGGSATDENAVPNYISFNDELWRIIGLFNTYNATTKTTEKALKIVRNNALTTPSKFTKNILTAYSWDLLNTDGSVVNTSGINEWSQADLMYELNGDYLDTTLTANTQWYCKNSTSNQIAFNYTQVIKEVYQQYIIKEKWYLGGTNRSNISAYNMYKHERGTEVYQEATDGVERTATWEGLIGLMYPSDYGYASADEICSGELCKYINDNDKTTNWIYLSKIENNKTYNEWFLTPYTGDSIEVFTLAGVNGTIGYSGVYNQHGVRPTLYLTSNTLITGGTGTSYDPYTISLL